MSGAGALIGKVSPCFYLIARTRSKLAHLIISVFAYDYRKREICQSDEIMKVIL